MPALPHLLDSNILIRWVKPDDSHYPRINAAIEDLIRQDARLCYTSQNLAEFWNACTRPAERNGFGLGIPETDRRAPVIEHALELLPDVPAVHLEWRRLIVACGVSGVQVDDARLVAAMRVYGTARILTLNGGDFARFPGIQAVHPVDWPQPRSI